MRKKYEKCVQYEKTSYLCPPVCRAGECGKIWTACNHNKKSLKQHVFYSNSQFFPFYTFLFIYRVIACPRQPFVGTGYFVWYRQVPSGEGIQGA